MEQLKKIGKVEPKKSKDIKTSRIGIGFEKLDRDLFDPEKAYPFFENLGVKKVRLQSGWQRTEKEKGVYDFAWLDSSGYVCIKWKKYKTNQHLFLRKREE
jgi:hypothetical protein